MPKNPTDHRSRNDAGTVVINAGRMQRRTAPASATPVVSCSVAGIALVGVGVAFVGSLLQPFVAYVAVAVVRSVLLDADALPESLSGVVLETVAPGSLWVWLRDVGGSR